MSKWLGVVEKSIVIYVFCIKKPIPEMDIYFDRE